MKRVQFRIEEQVLKLLEIRARQAQTSVSRLMRQAVYEKYLHQPPTSTQVKQRPRTHSRRKGVSTLTDIFG
jgi:hypothetical protein